MSITAEVIVRNRSPLPVEEVVFSHDFCFDYIKEFASPLHVKQLRLEELGTVGDLLSHTSAEIIVYIDDEEIIVPPLAFSKIPPILSREEWSAILPVSNRGRVPSQIHVPFLYHNVRNILEVAESTWNHSDDKIERADNDADWPCLFIQRDALEKSSPDMLIDDLWPDWASEGLIGQSKKVFVHRFGGYYDSPREDLIRLIPEEAVSILDVGCANGSLGKELKTRRHCRVIGIEPNKEMAENASRIYDEVHQIPVEEFETKDRFDAIMCGDVIEHLRDPLLVIRRLAGLLDDNGVIIGSMPNMSHWSIVMDQINGRFEMIPVGLLCMSHIRFFTEIELRRLLKKAGLEIRLIERDSPEPTPTGESFIRNLVELGYGDDETLRTAELRFISGKNIWLFR